MFNFKSRFRFTLLIAISIFVSACTSAPDQDVERLPDRSPQARYQEAKQHLNNNMYTRAIGILTDLESRYPFGPLSRQVQLDLMFAYYKSGKYEEALPAIDRFIRLNPDHSNLDYVIYMRGLVNMDTGENAFQNFFGIENADKDMEGSREAFKDFKKLVIKYPNSKYSEEAKSRMKVLLDKLASHEIVIAEYYMRRSSYVAAVNRCKYVLEYYGQSGSVKRALEIMIEAYDKLELPEMKADTEKVLAENFSD
ncbi:outer membrane protein assembly factor BamD [Psychrosphaera sp. B3R10]|uniref:outer membrane protein assembly factor BamD n=1 Tax=unclassified Psychrosphaera TaxID=2641570 RepID=UPI001C09260A|nr:MULTISPECIES: outer membrane protein assembly factor BamD [unclassified Psychrosphaera]MBU2884023.1 outer membrane protein assembly factor BamD [Psychrosphaera sp. I2R16]MBU2988153.1 outer membrane protein assembly factor BamD [Psychrosphaera sp. B3R10]MDO6718362.1 outer membrane protein assembly factor BamD [Psychrosphaera sp. 1_MG-2023]